VPLQSGFESIPSEGGADESDSRFEILQKPQDIRMMREGKIDSENKSALERQVNHPFENSLPK
jgi:hypothetical protein